jgi:hypothetical protein
MVSGGKALVLVRNLIPPAYTAYEDGTEGFKTSAYKIQKPGNDPKERSNNRIK